MKMHQQVDLSIAELQEMINRQQMQINTNEQILLAKEQRLRLLRHQLSKAAITSTTPVSSIGHDDTIVRKLQTLKRIIDQHKATRASYKPISDLDAVRQFCAEKEHELYSMLASNAKFKMSSPSQDFPARSDTQSRNLDKAEIDKLKQELIIRNRLNEQQSARILEQRQALVQRQHELVR
ncbi:hypothetical protein ACOME3_003858 [Neoechinorhynchus agilis]